MIYVDRSKVLVPEVLLSARTGEARAHIAKLLTESGDIHLEQLRVAFDTAIYSRCIPDLVNLFQNKCAYCETPLTGQPGDIEHFRPKQGAQDLEGVRQHLYYAWLAYDWENLLIACVNCNRRRKVSGKLIGKADQFPVQGARAPILASVQECRQVEMTLLIDPCYDNPADHLIFEESGLVSSRTPQGQTTIEILGLNVRKDLVEARRVEWLRVRDSFELWRLSTVTTSRNLKEDAASRLEEILQPALPYFAARFAAYETLRGKVIGQLTDSVRQAMIEAESSLARETGFVLRGAVIRKTFPDILETAAPPPRAQPPKEATPKRNPPRFHFERIRRVEIRNFKAIESLDLDIPQGPSGQDGLPGALMMLGENATGKSSILDAIALALLGTRQIARLQLDGRSFLRRTSMVDDKVQPQFPASIFVKFEDADSAIRLDIDLAGKFSGNEEPAVVLLGYGPRRYFWKGAQHIDAPAERIKSMFDPVVTLANPEEWLLTCSDDYFAFAVRALRDMLLLREEAVVKRLPEVGMPKTHVIFELEGREEELSSLSEGYKTVVAMGVDIMREMLEYWRDLEEARGVVLIDELDTHLHPRWKMRIAQRLRKALPNVQFLASTHDPLCLRGYHDGEVQVLRRDAEARIERVTDLPSVRGLSVQQLLTSEFFGLYSAEDPALDESMARYATLAMKRDRSAAEEIELSNQRMATDSTLQVGANEKERVALTALSEYAAEKRAAPQDQKAQLERVTVRKLVDLFKSVDEQDKQRP